MPNIHAVIAAFSAADATWIHQVVESFEAAWLSGRQPSIDDFLPTDAALLQAVLFKLVPVDLEYRLRAGEAIRVEMYLARYPELAAHHETVLELITWEHTLRRRQDPSVSAAEYRQRFPELPLPAEMAKPATEATKQPSDGTDEARVETDTIMAKSQSNEFALALSAPTGVKINAFEILGELGRGGMGVVYKARHLKLDRLVALKMILAGDHAGASALARFHTEAEAIARLQHPNIIQIFEVGEHEGKPYFSLEYCDGGSLSQKLAGTPLQPGEAAEIIETLARAMHVAHEKGVIHRDLKPANVLLMNNGTPKITDFGLAKMLDDVGQTHSGAIMGTPSYMAPEQATGKTKDLGAAVDVYALGAILYECLTGRPPFRAATPLDTIAQVINEEPVSPSTLQPRLPRDLETICLKCLSKDQRRRYPSAEAIAEDLRRFVAGETILARPPSFASQFACWCCHRDRIRDAGFFSVWMILVVAAWALCGITTQAIGAVERGSRWPFEDSRIPSKVDHAVSHFVGVLGGLFIPLFFTGLGAIRGKVAALWAGLVLSTMNLALMVSCLAGMEPVLSLIDLADLCGTRPVRYFAFGFPVVLFGLVVAAYSIALVARSWGRGTQQGAA